MRSTLLVLLSALEVASALAARAFVRAPPPAMLLGADGLPMKKGAATAPSGGGEGQLEGGLAAFDREGDAAKVLGTFSMPDDLSDFDPTVDPLAVKRPEYDLAAASGRPDEAVWGAVATESAAELVEWAAHMKAAGVTRMLGLFTADDAAARSGAATAEAYFADLVAAGPFDAASVGLLDPRAEGSREAVLSVLKATQAAREKICVHCADGHALTSVVLADWLLTDYIGGDNFEEACDALAARKRLSGVERRADPQQLEMWVTEGHL